MSYDMKLLIGGKLMDSAGGARRESLCPADEEVLGSFPLGTAVDVDAAVRAAEQAQEAWSALDMGERAEFLVQVAARLEADRRTILELEVADTGNTIRKMEADVAKASRMIRYYAGLGLELKGESVPATSRNLHFSIREPYGVVGRIIPFNHPINFAASRIAAPLMAGNTVVIKPSEQSPLSAGMLAEICADVLPAGVVNIVTGLGTDAGAALVRHPGVRRIAFIGSVETGMAIQRAAAEVSVKEVSLELGGKNPMIVFPDAPLEAAVDAAVAGMNFAWQGQSCGSVSRLFLHRDLYEPGIELIRERVSKLRLGDPLSYDSDMGPVNSKAQLAKVQRHIATAIGEGARVVTGADRPAGAGFDRGYWVSPTVLADVGPDMTVFTQEVFGPVMSIIAWSDYDELVQMANGVRYGLTAAIWTNDLRLAFTTARAVRAGYVWLNGVSQHFPGCGFGGVKDSGIGREEGTAELYSYTQSKFIHVLL